jgi:hypothetical protein
MSAAALLAFWNANSVLILTVALTLSEYLGANPKVKSNGLISFAIMQIRNFLVAQGAKDITK